MPRTKSKTAPVAEDTVAAADPQDTVTDDTTQDDTAQIDTDSGTEADAVAIESVRRAELLWLAPATIELDRHVRSAVDTDTAEWAEFVDSLRANGLIEAVTAIRTPEGVVKVQRGKRRLLAAVEAELDVIPVLVFADTAVTAKQRGFERIVGQIESNEHGVALTEGDKAAGVAEMLDLKIAQRDIRKAFRIKPEVLKYRAKVGRSQTAREALDAGQLSLEQAAIVGAFEAEGDTDAVQRLMGARDFRYEAQLIATDRAYAREFAEAAAPYAERGFTVLDDHPEDLDDDLVWTPRDRLIVAETGEPVTWGVVEADPAHWAVWLTKQRRGRVVVDSGEVVDPDLVDWSTEGVSDATAEDGYYHFDQVEVSEGWYPDYFTTDPDALGLRQRTEEDAATDYDDIDDESGDGNSASADRDDDDDGAAADRAAVRAAAVEQARAAAAQRDAEAAAVREQERADRRKTVRLNKLGEAAINTRREWLTTHVLARKTPPAQAAKFVAESLFADTRLLTQYRAKEVAAALLRVDEEQLTALHGLEDWIGGLTPNRAQVITLGLVLAAYEARIDKDSWKPNPYGDTRHGVYLHFLAELGYQLTPIEEVVAGDRDSDSLDTDTTTAPAEVAEVDHTEAAEEPRAVAA